eukprot:TRINITY_DN1351_c0_g1_i1.p1 TRINITY_DN1351_c0_g1~~TRINITY_DN1351_c0_g1_i1.p1  ORF type:complete len:164 (+),score=44.14 TRINITY_DN1351_c0_g1_i1:63-494(+)
MEATNDDFQMYFYCKPEYKDKDQNCKVPVCDRTCPDAERKCDDAKKGVDACFGDINWAMNTGMKTNPEWYGKFNDYVVGFEGELADATFQDWQMYFYCNPSFEGKKHRCNMPVCDRRCPKVEDICHKVTPDGERGVLSRSTAP